MNTEKIVATNIKCDGCATTIKQGLLKLNGVRAVEVSIADKLVTVSSEGITRKEIVEELRKLGYPESL